MIIVLTGGKKMKRIINILLIFVLCLLSLGCNPVTRKMGGDMTVHLKPGEKLVNVTWKEASLWFLTRPMKAGDSVETYKFKEDSTWGVLEGTVTIVEHK